MIKMITIKHIMTILECERSALNILVQFAKFFQMIEVVLLPQHVR